MDGEKDTNNTVSAEMLEAALALFGQAWEEKGRVEFRDALMSLPEDQEMALRLRFYSERTDEEAAELLGISESDVQKKCEEAVTTLHKRLTAARWPIKRATVEHILRREGQAAHAAFERQESSLPPPPSGWERIKIKDRVYFVFRKVPVKAVAAAVVVLVVLYGMLWFAGRQGLFESKTDILASLEPFNNRLQFIVSAYRSPTKGPDELPDVDVTMERLVQGIEALQVAHRRALGLFPHYDLARVAEAITHLEQTHQDLTALWQARQGQPDELEDEPQRALAAFLLAKAHLMKGDIATTRRWLDALLQMHPEVPDYKQEAAALKADLAAMEHD